MRPIKFRGRHSSGNVVFGSYDRWHGDDVIVNENRRVIPVEPDSVAQLVGHDSNGVEIYEGDTVVDQNGTEYVARQITVFMNDEDCVALSDSGKLIFTLKKEDTP